MCEDLMKLAFLLCQERLNEANLPYDFISLYRTGKRRFYLNQKNNELCILYIWVSIWSIIFQLAGCYMVCNVSISRVNATQIMYCESTFFDVPKLKYKILFCSYVICFSEYWTKRGFLLLSRLQIWIIGIE